MSIASGYKILFLVPFNGPSHWILSQNFAKELVNRGHEVTAIVNTPISNFKSPNYTEILIDPPFDLSIVCKYIHLILCMRMTVIIFISNLVVANQINAYKYILIEIISISNYSY